MLSAARSQAGLTLIEIMISIIIMVSLIAIGVPTFQSWVQNSQIRTTADALNNGLQAARGAAISGNKLVAFQLQGGTSWVVSEVATGTQLQQWSTQEGSGNSVITTTPADATTITFNSMGRMVANADGTAALTALDITPAVSSTDVRALRVAIGNAGSARMCDPHLANGDPRAC
jgi:type IV fimbrial biogenesis protein FimT